MKFDGSSRGKCFRGNSACCSRTEKMCIGVEKCASAGSSQPVLLNSLNMAYKPSLKWDGIGLFEALGPG